MTNLEWIRTLSAEELADWVYDEWLPRLQYRWSSSRGGLIIWLKDRKDEPNSSEKPNNCEPQTCENRECKNYDTINDHCMFIEQCHYEPKDEPTISKMEQVDKDINVRSKNEP